MIICFRKFSEDSLNGILFSGIFRKNIIFEKLDIFSVEEDLVEDYF